MALLLRLLQLLVEVTHCLDALLRHVLAVEVKDNADVDACSALMSKDVVASWFVINRLENVRLELLGVVI